MPCVYALATKSSVQSVDNIDIRYVGVARNAKRRLQSHISMRNTEDSDKARWIKHTIDNGDDIVLLELETSESYAYVQSVEVKYIADLLQLYPLYNVQTSGYARGGAQHTEIGNRIISEAVQIRIARDRASGRVYEMHSEKARARAAHSRIGLKQTEARRQQTRERMQKSWLDPAYRDKITFKMKGKIKSAEQRAKIAEATRKQMANIPRVVCPFCNKPIAVHRFNYHKLRIHGA